ncbi:hypothetical protein KUCAC02_007353, partial [Chaenocephalus aceratus]
MLRVFDPRAQTTAVQSAKSLQNNKDSRILWAKDDFLLTTGFDMMRSREARLWDSRKLSSSVSSVSLGVASGVRKQQYTHQHFSLQFCAVISTVDLLRMAQFIFPNTAAEGRRRAGAWLHSREERNGSMEEGERRER